MTEKESTLEQAARHVAEARNIIVKQLLLIEKLKASGLSTLGAEQTLNVFTSNLKLLEDHERHIREQALQK